MKALKKIEIQGRDVALFDRLCQLGYLTDGHIEEFIFPSAHYRTRYDRLRKLQQHRFIRKLRRRDELGTPVYVPVTDSLGFLLNEESLEKARRADHVQPWFTKTAPHDDVVRSVALRIMAAFRQCKVDLDFHLSAGKLESGISALEDRRKLPDLFVTFPDGRTISVEIELTNKSPARYQAILERYNWFTKNAVIYLYREPETLEAISSAVEAVSQIGGPLSFPLLTEKLEKTEEPDFVERIVKKALFQIESFAALNPPQPVRTGMRKRMLSEIIQ